MPPELIVIGFVSGEMESNYEFYLLEFVNASSFFLEKSQGQYYVRPQKESNGEYDCNSETYKLDFKLMASKTSLQAASILYNQKTVIGNGAWCTGGPKKENVSMETTRLHAALRGVDYRQLCKLRKAAPKKQGIENDIYHFLRLLETKKNVLFFFPYYLTFDSRLDFVCSNRKIQEALSNDFETAMQYRHNLVDDFDTYIAYIYDEHIMFMQEKDCRFNIVDYVGLDISPIYKKLQQYATFLI